MLREHVRRRVRACSVMHDERQNGSTHIRVGREPVGDGAHQQRPLGRLAGEHVAVRRVCGVRRHLVLQLQELVPERQLRDRRGDHLRAHQLALALASVLSCNNNNYCVARSKQRFKRHVVRNVARHL